MPFRHQGCRPGAPYLPQALCGPQRLSVTDDRPGRPLAATAPPTSRGRVTAASLVALFDARHGPAEHAEDRMPMATKIELKTSMFYVIRKNYGYFHYQILRMVFIFRYGFTCLIKPKYFSLFTRILMGLPLGKSLKQRQVIID
jgi:hypothetical protein